MLITSDELAARRLARQVADMKDRRNEQLNRQIIANELAALAIFLHKAEVARDKLMVAKVKRDIIDKTMKLIAPIPDGNKVPDRYGVREMLTSDLTLAISEARDFGITDDQLADGFGVALVGDDDIPPDGSLADILFDWSAKQKLSRPGLA